MKKLFLNLSIILISAVGLIVLVFFTSGVDELLGMLSSMKYSCIVVAFACMLMYWLFDSMILRILSSALLEKQSFLRTFKLTMIGQFFNAITPSATGGQPMQAYVMIKDGASVGHAASILIIRSILYQAVLAIYTMVVVFFKVDFFVNKIPHFFSLYVIGLVINLSVVILYTLFVFNKTAAHKLIMGLFNIVRRIRFLRKFRKYKRKLETELESFSEGAVVFKRNYKTILIATILQLVQLTFFFSIPYFIYLGIETGKQNPWDMIGVQAIITMITMLIPLPGASGGAEGVGYLFFSIFFRAKLVMPVVLLWRVITYYSVLLFGGLVSVLAPEKPFKKGIEPSIESEVEPNQ